MLNDLDFKNNCNMRPHFLGPMGGLKIEPPLCCHFHDFLKDVAEMCIRNTQPKSPAKCANIPTNSDLAGGRFSGNPDLG